MFFNHKKLNIVILLLLLLTILEAQTSSLKGIINFQNSGGKPAVGVKISAFGANSVVTNSSGMFELRFSDKKPGDQVRLSVGYTTRDNEKIEIVNNKLLVSARIPSDPNDIFDIIVCKLGERDEAALRYYGILKKASDDKFARKLNRIEQKIEENNFNVNTTASLIQEKEQLKKEKEEASKKIEQQAEYIATINKDNASEMVLEALSMIENGKEVSEAIEIIDDKKLMLTYKQAIHNKARMDTIIDNIIEAYKLKINFLLPLFRYSEALQNYAKLDTIFVSNNLRNLEIGELYYEYAEILDAYDNDDLALRCINKAINITEEYDTKDSNLALVEYKIMKFGLELILDKIDTYEIGLIKLRNELSSINLSSINKNNLDTLELVMNWQTEFSNIVFDCTGNIVDEDYRKECEKRIENLFSNLGIFESNGDCDVISLYWLKSYLYEDINSNLYLESLRIGANQFDRLLHDNQFCPYGIKILNKISSSYLEKKEYRLMEENLRKTSNILKQNSDTNFIDIGELYFDFGRVYKEAAIKQIKNTTARFRENHEKRYDLKKEYFRESLLNMQKGLFFLEKEYSANNPEMIPYYQDIAYVYDWSYDRDSALIWMNKCITIQENTLNPFHEDLEDSYNYMGYLYKESSRVYNDSGSFKNYSREKLDSALVYYLKSKDIVGTTYGKTSNELVSRSRDIAKVYRYLENLDESLDYLLFAEKHLNPVDTYAVRNNYNEMAEIYFEKKNYDKSYSYYLLKYTDNTCNIDSLNALEGLLTQFDSQQELRIKDIEKENLRFYLEYNRLGLKYLKCSENNRYPLFFFERFAGLIFYYLERGEYDLAKRYLSIKDYVDKDDLFSGFGKGDIGITLMLYYSCIEDKKSATELIKQGLKSYYFFRADCGSFLIDNWYSLNLACGKEFRRQFYDDLCKSR